MKFIIARTTAAAVLNAANETNLLVGETADYKLPSNEEINECDRLVNVSVRAEEANLIVEINDEVLLKYLALHMRTARLLAPVVNAAFHMWGAVQGLIANDCADLVAFIKARK